MRRHSHVGRVNSKPVAARSENSRRRAHMRVTAKHTLLTGCWKADVETLETAIRRFTAERPLTNDCHVVLFEIGGDGDLHVNVTHRYPTMPVRGWAGPARLAEGFVHNRVFSDTPPSRIVRHIRDMVFAAQDVSAAHDLR
jgi:hypothetical protein